jgi:hypothetical protein
MLLYQCSNFWLLKTWLCSPTLLSRLIWPVEISSHFWNKIAVKGCHFKDVSEIKKQSLTDLHVIPKCQFQQWQKHWTRYINSEGDYFKGDSNEQYQR